MKIRSGSWHYRLWKWGRDNPNSQPVDLCRYFWHIMLVKIMLPMTSLVIVLSLLGFLIFLVVTHLFQASVILATVAGIALLFGGSIYLDKRSKDKKEGRPVVVKEPGIVRQYLKARKAKVCPLIEVIDESAN